MKDDLVYDLVLDYIDDVMKDENHKFFVEFSAGALEKGVVH